MNWTILFEYCFYLERSHSTKNVNGKKSKTFSLSFLEVYSLKFKNNFDFSLMQLWFSKWFIICFWHGWTSGAMSFPTMSNFIPWLAGYHLKWKCGSELVVSSQKSFLLAIAFLMSLELLPFKTEYRSLFGSNGGACLMACDLTLAWSSRSPIRIDE